MQSERLKPGTKVRALTQKECIAKKIEGAFYFSGEYWENGGHTVIIERLETRDRELGDLYLLKYSHGGHLLSSNHFEVIPQTSEEIILGVLCEI